MFVSEERVLAAGFGEAAARLAQLPRRNWLRGLSAAVYAGGVEYLLRVGPLGAIPGASRLVRVRFADPVCRPGMMTVGLRWEATGITGGLFPALDADIQLTVQPRGHSRVVITGSYRPPFGAFGAELDRVALGTVASATIRTLLAQISDVLDGKTALPAELPGPWEPEPGPGAAPVRTRAFRPARTRAGTAAGGASRVGAGDRHRGETGRELTPSGAGDARRWYDESRIVTAGLLPADHADDGGRAGALGADGSSSGREAVVEVQRSSLSPS